LRIPGSEEAVGTTFTTTKIIPIITRASEKM
jgi:hypothetical protein